MEKLTIIVLVCSFFNFAIADSSDGIERLLEASCKQNISLIQSILREGVNPNDFYNDNFPLNCAAVGTNPEAAIKAINILIKSGADPNLQNGYGQTALMSVVDHYWLWHPDVAQTLLNNGAKTDLQNRYGDTALMSAGWRPEAVEFLIKAGASVDVQDKFGRTALMLFISNIRENEPEYSDSVDIIIKAKPNLELEQLAQHPYADKGERTALDLAVIRSLPVVASKLLKAGAKVEGIGRSALNVAANAIPNSIEVAGMLLKAGAQINFRDGNGNTPLINSIIRSVDQIEMSKFLIASGADLNLKNNQGNTALIFATYYYHRGETILALLAAGANPNIQNQDNVTAIMGIRYQVDMLQKFVDSGASLDLQDRNGTTVLMINIYDLKSVNFCITSGANLNLRNNEGHTALGLARDQSVRDALIRAGGIE